jgi:FMN phosphatase YigB (HAD superfamily)
VTRSDDLVILIDVDNTLLDNGELVDELKRTLTGAFSDEGERRYWQIFETLWNEVGYADYLGALQRLRLERPRDQGVMRVSQFLLTYPFADRVYPGALNALEAARRRGRVVIVSDGDAVYQPHKVERSGLSRAVEGHVLIYVHKEEMLDDIALRYPAPHYVVVDDKLRILAAMKAQWGPRVTTVFVRQGHYALDPAIVAAYPAADVTIERIADLPDVKPISDV